MSVSNKFFGLYMGAKRSLNMNFLFIIRLYQSYLNLIQFYAPKSHRKLCGILSHYI